MTKGHTITRQAGEAIAKDMRNRRFAYQRKRATLKPAADGGGAGEIEFTIVSLRSAASTGDDAPYSGLFIATVNVAGASPDRAGLIGTTVDVVDHSGGIFDLPEADLVGVWGWAAEKVFPSLAPGALAGERTAAHWSATRIELSIDVDVVTGFEVGTTGSATYLKYRKKRIKVSNVADLGLTDLMELYCS